MFRVTRYPIISKTESGRVRYRKKYRVAGRVRVPAGHWWLSKAFQAFANVYAFVFKGLYCPYATIKYSQLLAILWSLHQLHPTSPSDTLMLLLVISRSHLCTVHVIPSVHLLHCPSSLLVPGRNIVAAFFLSEA